MDYARNTNVSIDSSQQEVTRLLRRAGAEKQMIGGDGDFAFVAFVLQGNLWLKKIGNQKLAIENRD